MNGWRQGTLLWLLPLLFSSPAHGADTCECAPKRLKVAVDVGHSQTSAGATSAHGRPEFAFNLNMGQLIHDHLLQCGFERSFTIINPDSLKERVRIAEERQADLLIAVHHDSVQPYYLQPWTVHGRQERHSDAFRGYSILVSTKNLQFSGSLELAKAIGHNFRKAGFLPAYHHSKRVPGGRHNMLDEELGIYQFDDLVVLKYTSMPAVLVEFGVIVHRDEELMLEDGVTQDRMMRAVVDGVKRYQQTTCARE